MRSTATLAVLMGLACAPSFADEWRPDLIAMYESSGGQNVPNFRFDGPRGPHSAGGVCQMLTHTWERIAPTIDIDIVKYPVAGSAPEFDQWRACWKLWSVEGYSPWTCCNAKLRQALARRGMDASPVRKVSTKEKRAEPSDDKVASFSSRLAANSDVYHR
jgi:hypothetical protein